MKQTTFKNSSLQSDTVKVNLRRLQNNLNSPFIFTYDRLEIIERLVKNTLGSNYEVTKK